MITDQDRERYIHYKTNYPELTRAELYSIFPNVTELEIDKAVIRELASRKMSQLDQVRDAELEKQYKRLARQDKLDTLKARSLEVLEEALYSKDKSMRYRAAVKVLGAEFAYREKTAEILAERECAAESPDEPYSEPSRPAQALDS